MSTIQVLFLTAIAGHLLCGCCDCLLTYVPGGKKFDFRQMSDNGSMSETFAKMPLRNPRLSMVLGCFALLLCSGGYYGIYLWMKLFSNTYAVILLISAALFFIPGFEVLEWRAFEKSINWSAFFLPASMISIGAAITSSGLSQWIAQVVFPSSMSLPVFVVVGFISLLTFLLLIPIPVAPALVTMLGIPLIEFAATAGISPVLLVITLGLTAANCYLLPLDTVPIMTYATGAYKMFDMPKASVWIQLLFVVIASIWIPIAGMILGVI